MRLKAIATVSVCALLYIAVSFALVFTGNAAVLGLDVLPRKLFLGSMGIALGALFTLYADKWFAPTISKFAEGGFNNEFNKLSPEQKCSITVRLYSSVFAACVIGFCLA